MTERLRRPVRLVAALAAATLLAGGFGGAARAALAAAKPRHQASHAAPAAKLLFGRSLLRAPAVAVTMAPAGVSIEYPVMAGDMGSDACPPRRWRPSWCGSARRRWSWRA